MNSPPVQTETLIRHEIERVLAREAQPERLRSLLEAPGSFDHALWQQAVDQGWPGLAFSEDVGGLGMGWRGLSEVAAALGQVTGSLPLITNYVIGDCLLGAVNKQAFTTQISALAEGRVIGALCLSESGDSNLLKSQTLQMTNGLLSGTKSIAAFAAVAGLALVSAVREGKTILALVDLEQAAVRREIVPVLDNARAAALLHFDQAASIELDCGCDPTTTLTSLLSKAATMMAFEQIGGSSACLKLARDYAMERKAFGGPIGRFQAIKHKLADMYSALEIAKGCAIEALDELESGKLSIASAAAARLAAMRAYEFAARETIQTHGGIGVTWEAIPHQHYRRARSLALELGTKPFWRDLLVSELSKENAGAHA